MDSTERVSSIVRDFERQLEDKYDVTGNEALAVASTLLMYLCKRIGGYTISDVKNIIGKMWDEML